MIRVMMSGGFNSVDLDMTEREFVGECNLAARSGDEFLLGRKESGGMVIINLRNILTAETLDADLLG